MQRDAARFPVDSILEDLLRALRSHSCVVVEAPPGAGKTTRVPRALLESPLVAHGELWVTEPRRVAARLAARYVAEQLGQPVGQTVGYRVREEARVGPHTKLCFVTEGILLERLTRQGAPRAKGLSAVVLDEFHERHVETDLLLLLLRRQQQLEPQLKLVVMSATLDSETIAAHLGNCPQLTSAGRTFPLCIEHTSTDDDRPLEKRVSSAVKKVLQRLPCEPVGNVLAFLPGQREISRSRVLLEPALRASGTQLLPLHGSLPLEEQARAIGHSDHRKVVLATNVAESSITVAGVTAVVDSGLERIAEHSPWTGRPGLRVAEVSQASAVQRAGRAGRVAAGHVVRLYSEANFRARARHGVPELQRCDLVGPLLRLLNCGIELSSCQWLSAPDPRAERAALQTLGELGLVANGDLTALGRAAARLPVHPRLGVLALAASRLGFAEKGCLTAALLSEGDPRAASRRDDKPSAHDCDVAQLMDAFEQAQEARFEPRVLSQLGLNARRVQEIRQSARRLRSALPAAERLAPTAPSGRTIEAPEEALAVSLLAGFPERVARRRSPSGREVILASGHTAQLSESTRVVGANLLLALDSEDRTSPSGRRQTFARLASPLRAEWLLDHHDKRLSERQSHQWDETRGRVLVANRLCYGAVVLEESLHPADPGPQATELLLRAARAQRATIFGKKDAQGELFARLQLAARLFPEEGYEHAVDGGSETLLARACEGRTRLAELEKVDWAELVLERLAPRLRGRLERLAPTSVALPGGRRVTVHYQAEHPWIESRLQDFFGMTEGPRIAEGRIALTLHLLAPNQRAVQVTRDLAGFWNTHYPELRRALSRRYPKHAWPEDAASARPPAPQPRRPRR